MLLGPVTIAASLLPLIFTAAITSLALSCSGILYLWSVPIIWPETYDAYHSLYLLAQWIAICVSCIFIGGYVWQISYESKKMSRALSATREELLRQQRISSLGTQAAAAAHELGSPLSTIAIIVKEMEKELSKNEDFKEDIKLLSTQTQRCSNILKELSQNKKTTRGELLPPLTTEALIKLIAAPYLAEKPDVEIEFIYEDQSIKNTALFHRTPEISHGLGNLIQNAIGFAKAGVKIIPYWDDKGKTFTIDIIDDGKGFSSSVLSKIGEPYISSRKTSEKDTGGNMGLGIFIAKTLLESTGANLKFTNAANKKGGIVKISWPKDSIERFL